MYTGDFSNWVDRNNKQIPVFDPTSQVKNADGSYTRTQFAGNKIPTSMFDPALGEGVGRLHRQRNA